MNKILFKGKKGKVRTPRGSMASSLWLIITILWRQGMFRQLPTDYQISLTWHWLTRAGLAMLVFHATETGWSLNG